MMKIRWLALVTGVCLFIGAGIVWDRSASVIADRMLDRTARFLGAIQAGDRSQVLKLSYSEEEQLEDLATNSREIARGEFSAPGLFDESKEAVSIWAPKELQVLGAYSRSPVSYSLNTDPDTPSIALNFDCSKTSLRCLEHAKIFFTPRAQKIRGYVMFWNEPEWRELWQGPYSQGLVTKRCDDACPF